MTSTDLALQVVQRLLHIQVVKRVARIGFRLVVELRPIIKRWLLE